MSKRAVSAVIAAVLIILITIAAISILWAFVFPIMKNITTVNKPVSLEIVQEGYTAWDPINRLAEIQVKRGSDSAKLEGFDFVFVLDGNSFVHEIRREIQLNSKGIYYFNFSNIEGNLQMVKLVPVFDGNRRGDVVSILMVSSVSTVPLHGGTYINPKTGEKTGGVSDPTYPGDPTDPSDPKDPDDCDECTSKGCKDGDTRFFCGEANDGDSCLDKIEIDCGADEICKGGECEVAVTTPECEDEICNEGENCSNCPADCGACPIGALIYVDPANGNDSGDGSLNSPYNTLSKAINASTPRTTIYLKNGDYENLYIQINNSDRNSWDDKIVIKPMPGHDPDINSMNIYSSMNAFVEFTDLTVKQKTNNSYYAVRIARSSHIMFQNSKIEGYWPPTWEERIYVTDDGIIIEKNCSYITIYNNDVSAGSHAITVEQPYNTINLSHNYVHKIAQSFIRFPSTNNEGPAIIEYNRLEDYQGHPVHGGSGLSLRTDNLIIRGNVIKAWGGSGAMTFYQPGTSYSSVPGGYKNMLIENNVIYGSSVTRGVEHYHIHSNYTFRNNTYISNLNKEYYKSSRYRYINGVGISLQADAPGNEVEISNNLVIGGMGINPNVFAAGGIEKNNLYWYLTVGEFQSAPYGDGSLLVSNSYKGYTVPFYGNYFEIAYNFFVGGDNFENAFNLSGGSLPEPEVFSPMITSIVCNGTLGPKGVPFAGALPCVCTNNAQCAQVFGTSSTCNTATRKCV